MQILKSENNILVACKFQIAEILHGQIEMISFFRRLSLLPPVFTTRFVLLDHKEHVPHVDLFNAARTPGLNLTNHKRDAFENLLQRLKCVRICSSEGKCFKEDRNVMITCAFGFRASAAPTSTDSDSDLHIHILAYEVCTFILLSDDQSY